MGLKLLQAMISKHRFRHITFKAKPLCNGQYNSSNCWIHSMFHEFFEMSKIPISDMHHAWHHARFLVYSFTFKNCSAVNMTLECLILNKLKQGFYIMFIHVIFPYYIYNIKKMNKKQKHYIQWLVTFIMRSLSRKIISRTVWHVEKSDSNCLMGNKKKLVIIAMITFSSFT